MDEQLDPILTDAQPSRLPFGFCKRHGIVLNPNPAQPLEFFYHAPVRLDILSELQRHFGQHFKLTAVSNTQFNRILQDSHQTSETHAMEAMEGFEQEADLISVADQLPEPSDLLDADDDAPVIRLINAILTQAVKENASDIHVEPYENRLVVRLRVDGVMREVLSTKNAAAPLVVSRIKVMAQLDIAEKRLPQDGRIGIRIAGRAVDCRVSTLPSGHGERVVIRLLDKQAGRLTLDQLGMPESIQQRFDVLIKRPHGIILVTGPTGSGKTTTLYAGLSRINDKTRNIMTVEDPIEYYIDGIGQTQVNTKVDMTFARGLRAILRQDPDVVLVGEIRDVETADIAVQSSLTGHLVLSTLHTNTAVGAITRLRDMGVEPFLLSSSLVGVLAQRLVRVLCEHCKEERPLGDEARRKLKALPGLSMFHPIGCEHCQHSGYRGRTGIHELIAIDGILRTLIHDGASEQALETAARERSPGIIEDARQKILAGITTLEEVLRVTREQ